MKKRGGVPGTAAPARPRPKSIGTFWNGEPCEARRVTVTVADDGRFPGYWARSIVGTRRRAVEVVYGGETFYLDDEPYYGPRETEPPEIAHLLGTPPVGYDGWAWDKVSLAYGSPAVGHREFAVEPGSVEPR